MIRSYYQRRLPEDSSKDYYFIHRETGTTEPILVEYGFIDNPADAAKLQENALDYSEAVVRAVSQYAGIPYTPPEGSQTVIYTVQAGDSLYSIANKFGTTVDNLRKLNNLTSDVFQIGQTLKVTDEDIVAPPQEGFISYTVKPGDTLSEIAEQYNTTTKEIMEINGLTNTTIYIGQSLLIPITGETPESVYTVVSGDSLYNIARKFNTTVDELKKINGLTSDILSIGQTLIIPTDVEPETPEYITYTVKAGDSLYKIAYEFDTTVDEIKKLNNLSTTLLQIGQQLKIPTISNIPNYIDYIVKSGDSLYRIAMTYNTTVDEIKRVNNLTSNLLSIGQQLKIPN